MEEELEIQKLNIFPDSRSSGLFLNIAPNNFLLIGGGSRDKSFDDIWQLTLLNSQSNDYSIDDLKKICKKPNWKKLSFDISNNLFNARFGHSGVSFKNEDENLLNLYIHGGQNHFTNSFYSDFFSLKFKNFENINSLSYEQNINSKLTINIDYFSNADDNSSYDRKTYNCIEFKNEIKFPVDINKTPCERNSHTMVLNYNTKKCLYIYGGGNSTGLLNDLWEFSLDTGLFKKILIDANRIAPREMHGMIYYKDHLYIFGGRLYDSIDKNMFRINLTNLKIESDFTNLPCSLCSFSYSLYKNYLIIYGGTDGINFLNNLYIYNLNNNKWAKSKLYNGKNGIDFSVDGKIGSHMSIDEESDLLVIFGGSSIHQDTKDTCIISISELLNENNLIQVLNN